MHKSTALPRWPIAVALLASLTACPRRIEIELVGQEGPGRPVFSVVPVGRGKPNYLGAFTVTPCEQFDGTARAAYWFILGDAPVERFVYGKVPAGYSAHGYMTGPLASQATAEPLAEGCYVADTEGTGNLRFTVSRDGSVLLVAPQQE